MQSGSDSSLAATAPPRVGPAALLALGATGALLAGAGLVGLAALRAPSIGAVVAAGGVLMAHDWHDRRLWFARGWQ